MQSTLHTTPLEKVINTLSKIQIPKDAELELEMRFQVDERRSEKTKYNRLSATDAIEMAKNIITDSIAKKIPCKIEQSINFIKSGSKGANIKQMMFLNGIQQKQLLMHYIKERIMNPMMVVDTIHYKITASLEHVIEPFNIDDHCMGRIKLRFSIDMYPWRLDMTLVKSLQDLSDHIKLKKEKEKMLYKINVDNFVDKAPWDYATHIEFEAEYIGKPNTKKNNQFDGLNIEDIDSISKFINTYSQLVNRANIADGDETDLINGNDINENVHSYQRKIYEVATLLYPKDAYKFKHKMGIKQLSNQVVELDKNTFLTELYNKITNYYITDKVDGKRAILYITKDGVWEISNELKSLLFNSNENIMNDTYIFDTEQYKNEYYIFDVLMWENELLIDKPFETRKKYFDKAEQLSNKMKNLTIKQKRFVLLTNDFQNEIKTLKNVKKPYETDGFVLTPVDGYYKTMKVYKYKPINSLSVDFLVKRCPQYLLGIKPYIANSHKLYILFSGISKSVMKNLKMKPIKYYDTIFPDFDVKHLPDYLPIQFEPSDCKYAYLYWGNADEDLDGQVCEFIIKNPNDKPFKYQWKLLRIREDRKVELERGTYFGNNYKIAELAWFNYQNPLIIEDMKFDNVSYFQEHNSELHKVSRNFNSFVKSTIFLQYKNTENIMDLASGKGQDLFRYASNHMGYVLFTEMDKTAITELIHRKHAFSYNRNNQHMRFGTQCLDLTASYKYNIEQLLNSNVHMPNNGFDLIVCNFAFHYFTCNNATLVNVINFINRILKPGGRFIMTAFDGRAVLNLLNTAPSKKIKGKNVTVWESSVPGKFSIIKDFKGDALKTIGQKIKVLLPFSSSEYYSECLVNIDHLEAEFGKKGIILETNTSFSEYIDEYKNKNKNKYVLMDADDKTYVSLYSYYGFYKNKK